MQSISNAYVQRLLRLIPGLLVVLARLLGSPAPIPVARSFPLSRSLPVSVSVSVSRSLPVPADPFTSVLAPTSFSTPVSIPVSIPSLLLSIPFSIFVSFSISVFVSVSISVFVSFSISVFVSFSISVFVSASISVFVSFSFSISVSVFARSAHSFLVVLGGRTQLPPLLAPVLAPAPAPIPLSIVPFSVPFSVPGAISTPITIFAIFAILGYVFFARAPPVATVIFTSSHREVRRQTITRQSSSSSRGTTRVVLNSEPLFVSASIWTGPSSSF